MSLITDLFSVVGRTVVITGGGAGIGYSMAEAWVKNGGKVYINSRREGPLKEAVAKLNAISQDSAFYVAADVATKEGVDKLVKDVASRELSIDVLVNNAGMGHFDVLEPGAFLPTYDPDAWAQQFSLNAWSPAAVTSAFAPLLVEAAKKGEGRGSVILVSSISDSMWYAASEMTGVLMTGTCSILRYKVSKVAETALTKILANKLVAHGVRVNVISPGTFPTPANDPSNEIMPSRQPEKHVPMKRNGTADDIAGAFLYLATRASSYVTGERFAVDGGWLLVANGRFE
ncbi:NAD(P)-binding protein [Dentipellis sp. KUC8613]|nr:NAD(P)-binding protein [Dentipellis sp. KUC8613]